jgi:hypothetical protein
MNLMVRFNFLGVLEFYNTVAASKTVTQEGAGELVPQFQAS